jgi:photosystem II stability/assembly factor-like uncharacterized protein
MLLIRWMALICFMLTVPLVTIQAQEPQEHREGEILFREAWPDREAYLRQIRALETSIAQESDKSAAGWQNIPYRALRAGNPNGSYWSGRVVDIDFFPGDSFPYVLSASGGLYRRTGNGKWQNISASVTSPAGGAFAVCPRNRNFIVLGTGEFTQSDGTGLWITHDGGNSWFQPDSFPHASARNFFRIFFDPFNDSLLHIVSSAGYYQSPDLGQSFIRKRTGRVCWVEQSALNPDILYSAVLQSGVYKSSDKGNTWQLLPRFSDSNLGKTRIALCPSDDQVVFVHGARFNDQKTKGFYFSKDGGTTWDTAQVFMDGRFQTDWHYGQGNYNNALAISADCRDVLAAGVPMIRANPVDSVVFTYFESNHVDVHDIVFKYINNIQYEIWNANDGGIARYRPGIDARFVGNEVNEFLPITQMYEHDGDKKQLEKVAIATQDNMVAVRLHDTSPFDWMTIWGGDGFSLALDNSNSDRFIARANDFVFRTFDFGQSYSGVGAALDPDFRTDRLRFDFNHPSMAFATCENSNARHIVVSSDNGSSWTRLNATDFSSNVQNLSISAGSFPNLYAVSWSATADRLWVRDRLDGNWYERSNGIIPGQRIEFVMPDVSDPDIALAYLNGNSASLASNKLYYTEDAGRNWLNVSGDLPAVPVRSALIYPYNRNIMLVGTYGAGFFITRDGGNQWKPWNKGVSPYVYVYSRRSFSWVDSSAQNGKFYILAGTYGNGLLYREISDSDTALTSVSAETNRPDRICDHLVFNQDLGLALPETVTNTPVITLQIYEISGKEIYHADLHHESLSSGLPSVPPGFYIVRWSTPRESCARSWLKTK